MHTMKRSIRGLLVYFFLLGGICLLFAGCKKEDNGLVFGNEYVYMPQALQSGGINLEYQVPGSLDSAGRNYRVDSVANRLNVILGVSRSGMQDPAGYSVQVSGDADTVAQAIASGALAAVLLPEKAYTLPDAVTVPAGSTAATFSVSVDMDALKAFAGKKVALAVKISSPSRYQLNDSYSETIVVIDVDALHL